MNAWTDSSFRQGRDEPRRVHVDPWALLGFIVTFVFGPIALMALAVAVFK